MCTVLQMQASLFFCDRDREKKDIKRNGAREIIDLK